MLLKNSAIAFGCQCCYMPGINLRRVMSMRGDAKRHPVIPGRDAAGCTDIEAFGK